MTSDLAPESVDSILQKGDSWRLYPGKPRTSYKIVHSQRPILPNNLAKAIPN